MANNKVQLANGTVLIDITDTTAVASDVAAGKYFYNAAGVKTEGTASGGGGYTIDDIADRAYANYENNYDLVFSNATRIAPFAFNRGTMKSVYAPNVQYFTQYLTNTSGNGSYAFEYCLLLTSVNFPNLVDVGNGGYQFNNCRALTSVIMPKANFGDYMFNNCLALQNIALGYGRSTKTETKTYMFSGCSSLVAIDLSNISKMNSNFIRDSSASILILRDTTIVPLANTYVFDRSKFANGGTGGTIYIPKTLYDHLGDGTSSDYKAATNWSTYNGYGTITWAKIEGSIYENAYADGTPIS